MPDNSEVSLLAFYMQFVKREKAIYCNLNKFRREGSLVYGVCWSNLEKLELIETFYGPENTSVIAEDSPRQLRPQIDQINYKDLVPPTYFKTN